MKTIIKLSLITVMASGLLYAQETKRYEIKSAKIEYSLKTSGDIMGGLAKVKGIGKKRLIFDNYGMRELTEENKVTKTTTMGQTKVDKNHTLKYMNGAVLYSTNFEKKKIIRLQNPMSRMGGLFGGDVSKKGQEMLEKMGGKKIGTDKVAGVKCDIWDLSGIKQCLYKGIPLKVESNIMGIKSVEIATKAEFDLDLKDDDFKLPDYPIYGINGGKLDQSKLEEMDKKSNIKSKEEAKKGAKVLEGLGVGIAAAEKEGYDPKSGKEMTPAQEKAMRKAMMNAMGGESAMLKRQKQKILKNAKNISKARECFTKAENKNDANRCEEIMDSEDPEHHSKWNKSIKSNLLEELDTFEKSIPCIEKAKTFFALKSCFPDEE